ncbi:MAG: response regulator transcription factor [Nannocystis sp.]|nr:response regulator transcription factor [Nannocystis sp.]
MQVLIADDDPISATILASLLERAGHTCQIVHDGAAAWQIARRDDAPRILFLDWMMPELDGLDLCRRVRAQARPDYTYIAILSVRNKQRDITLAFQSGADDFITKPYQAEEVLARLRVAERVIRTTSAEGKLHRAFTEARQSPGGDLIVRSGSRAGRIMLHGGRIAWAHVSDEPGTLAAMLASEPSITKDDVKAVIEECTETGRSFAEVLVEWGIIDASPLRELTRAWIAGKIATICAFPAPTVIFSPETRAYSGHILFMPEEVAPPELLELTKERPKLALVSAEPPPGDPEIAALALIDRAMAIDGALSAAVFDGHTGGCLGARGEPLDLDLVWHQLKIAANEALVDLDDIIITTRQHLYILRPISSEPPRCLFIALDRASARLGMVRLALADCARS